ncbi:MAG: putative acid phosphatase [Aeromicrobium sp.]|nr:putative acid phosphatase [Aeromicrobium sp.]
MSRHDAALSSWRPGPTRDAIAEFLEQARQVPVERRVACFDNDGTLWCERPNYVQLDFFVDVMKTAVDQDPDLARKPEFAALISDDAAAIGDLGLERIAFALAGLCSGLTPEEFTARVRGFMASATHPVLDRPLLAMTYQPMLELLEELRRLDFTVTIVTGGGTEFVRAVSQELYDVPPEAVVGTLLEYDYAAAAADRPVLRRSTRLLGAANEGPAKVSNIQTQLGRRPILAAGNSGGDREMLEWAATGEGPTLALLVDHDDEAREFSYRSSAETFTEAEPITTVGERLGWTVASMARDWETVFDRRAS